MDLKVILDVTPVTYGRTYDKTCKSASLSNTLCNSVRRDNLRCITPQKDGKVLLTRREHASHVIEGH